MAANKADIIARLQRDILPLQGFKTLSGSDQVDVGLGIINNAFPGKSFPLGAVHEFCCEGTEDAAATAGFIGGIIGNLMKKGGAVIYISSSRKLFPCALPSFGIEADKIIFIDLKRERDLLWAIEEALKCDGLAAVIGEIRDISFTASRRLQLAVEKSRVTGFIVRTNSNNPGITACVARWKISSLPSEQDEFPGVGFPRWQVDLVKIRNGSPGNWQLTWAGRQFQVFKEIKAIPLPLQKKTG